jgi:hypothetical protein
MATLKEVASLVASSQSDKEKKDSRFRTDYTHFEFGDASLFSDYIAFIKEDTARWISRLPGVKSPRSIDFHCRLVTSLFDAVKYPTLAPLIDDESKKAIRKNIAAYKKAMKAVPPSSVEENDLVPDEGCKEKDDDSEGTMETLSECGDADAQESGSESLLDTRESELKMEIHRLRTARQQDKRFVLAIINNLKDNVLYDALVLAVNERYA